MKRVRGIFLHLLLLLLLLLLAGAGVNRAFGDGYMVSNWRNEQGLPHSIVNSIVQTPDGYLWIGTYVGLVRFDGVRFVHYSSANTPELGSGRVTMLMVDHTGTLWVGLESGRLLAFKDGVMRVHLAGGPESSQPFAAMAEDLSGTIWLQTSDGKLGRLTEDGVQFVAESGSGLGRPSLGLVVDGNGNLWVGTRDGLRVWRDSKFVTPPSVTNLPQNTVDALTRGRDGSVWTYRESHVWNLTFDKVLKDIQTPPQLTNFVQELVETSRHEVWLAVADGTLFYLDAQEKWHMMPTEPGLLGPNRSIMEDREGDLWRGSFGGGLTRLRPKIFTVYSPPTTTLDRYVYSVTSDSKGDIWAGLNIETPARIPAGGEDVETWKGAPVAQGLRTLFVDKNDVLWGGANGGAVFRLRGGAFVQEFRVDAHSEMVNAFYEDAQSNLWVGFTSGAGVGVMPMADPKKWRIVPGVPFTDVRTIVQAADGAMWFGTHYGGASRFKDGQWTKYTTQDGLPSDYVRCLHADADGTVWLGTIRGLGCWRNGKFKSVTSDDGLWSDSLSHIDEDGDGNFWFSSFGGIFRVNHKELKEFVDGSRNYIQCVGYTHRDGLPSQECPGGFQPAGAKTPDGRLWFPTVSGLVSLDPEHLPQNNTPPAVMIEEMAIDGAAKEVRHSTEKVTATPGKRRLDFRFTATSFASPEKVRFKHQLEGLDTDWSKPDDRREAAYSYVPPGQYTFRVVACNNDGVWSPEGASLAVIVQPFLWQTWWFRSGTGIAVALGIVAGARMVERRKNKLRLEKLEQQHALERERARIAKDIHDDLGASLTQIVFLSERVEGGRHDPDEVNHWIHRIHAAARKTIQSLDEIVWAVSPKHDTLESLANYLSQFAQEHLGLAGVRCVLEVPTVLPAVDLSAEVRHNLLLATREAIQNVVSHAAASEVKVILQLGPEALEITITDNGKGFDPAAFGPAGNGLHNIRRRLEEVGGRLDLWSKPSEGTRLQFWIPRSRLHIRGIVPE